MLQEEQPSKLGHRSPSIVNRRDLTRQYVPIFLCGSLDFGFRYRLGWSLFVDVLKIYM